MMIRSIGGRCAAALLLVVVVVNSFAAAGEVSLVPALPRIGEGGAGNHITAVSADGTTAVVQTYEGNSPASSLWTRGGGHVEITPNITGSIFATDVNGNGTVAAGFGFVSGAADARAVRWTAKGGIADLGAAPGLSGPLETSGISVSGDAIAGTVNADTHGVPFRWTQSGGIQLLTPTPNGAALTANGISGDGSTVVGSSGLSSTSSIAWRWTRSGGYKNLGDLPGGAADASAAAANGDGSIVVGEAELTAGGSEAFRWTEADGMVGLGFLAGARAAGALSSATSVSADGSVVVGSSDRSRGGAGFVWTQQKGMQYLGDYLADNGVNATGWTFLDVTDVSADGKTFVGAATFGGRDVNFMATVGPSSPPSVPLPPAAWAGLPILLLALTQARRGLAA